jgi:hypothetical protein
MNRSFTFIKKPIKKNFKHFNTAVLAYDSVACFKHLENDRK